MTTIKPATDDHELVAKYDYLAQRIARRYMHGHSGDEDLVQAARLGLIEAAARYDPQRGPFVAFASPTIIGTLKKHLRSTGWAVHVPRSVQEQTITVENSIDLLTQQLGHTPSINEIATATGLPVEDVLRARRAREARFTRELPAHDPLAHSDGDSYLQLAVAALNAADQELIRWRYSEDLTQQEIAARLGISQPQVYRRLKAILLRLGTDLREPDTAT